MHFIATPSRLCSSTHMLIRNPKVRKIDPPTIEQSMHMDGNMLYAQLRERVRAQGIFDRDYGYYIILLAIMLAGFFLSILLLFLVNNPLILILICISLSFFTVQLAGIVHDAGHRAIFASPIANDIAGYFFGALLGWAYTPWRSAHNKHHAHTNQKGEDPDLEIPIFTFTMEHFKRRSKAQQFLIKYQTYLYYPFGAVAASLMRVGGFSTLIQNSIKDKKVRFLEVFITFSSLVIWYVLPFFFFGIGKALLILVITTLVTGFYLFNIFAPNHKGMPQLSADEKLSFMEQQIMTSRNVSGNWFLDIVYLGLNYQIEHHLFPSVARNKLKLTTPYILQVCRQRNIEFTSVNIIQTNRIILAELKKVSLEAMK